MKKLIMTKGLPGSGKSTWAYEYLEDDPNTVLVCKDDLRAMMFNSSWTGNREKEILKVRDFIVSEALKSGKNVIVHDTNLAPRHEERLKQLARELKAEFVLQDFTNISVEKCIERDLMRDKSIGEKVIKQMYDQWLKPKPPILKRNPKLSDAIICDLDGTLALFGDNDPYNRDFSQDIPNKPVVEIINKFAESGTPIVILSGRNGEYKEITEKWLEHNKIIYTSLYMRISTDKRKDAIVKKEMYESFVKGVFNVLFVLDDRNQVVELWRSLGLTCLQVAEGDF